MADAVLLLVKSGTETEAVGDTTPMPVQIIGGGEASGPTEVTGLEGAAVEVSDAALDVALSAVRDAIVTALASVEIRNDSGNPVPVSGTVEVTNDAGSPLPVSGSVSATDQKEVFENGAQVVVGAAAVEIASAVGAGVRKSVLVQNLDAANAVRIGLAGVTATTGFLHLAAGDAARLPSDQALYAIRTGDADVTVLVSETA